MSKKIILLALIFLPLGVFAQDLKIAYFNSDEVIAAMPETAAMKATLEKMEKSYSDELKILEDEFTKKFTALQQQSDTLVESIRVRRLQEIQELRQRAETFSKDSYQRLQEEQKKLFDPIVQKVNDAIKVAGDENGYSYIMQTGVFLYISTSNSAAINATPLIKKKLNLQ